METPNLHYSRERVDDRLAKFLEDILQEALLHEQVLKQQLAKVAADIQDCQNRMHMLGLGSVESGSPAPSTQTQEPMHQTSLDVFTRAPITLPRAGNDAASSKDTSPSNSDHTINSLVLLSVLSSRVEGFSSESATQAYLKRKPEDESLDFNYLRIKIGKTLSRLAYKKKVARFQLKGRPSQVRYLSTEWFDKNDNILPEYSDVLSGLEPILTREEGQAETEGEESLASENPTTSEPVAITLQQLEEETEEF